jgi:phage N-6-adenine-methyltransferase
MAKETFKTIHGNEYCTPDEVFETLNDEFNFTTDLACTKQNMKTKKGLYLPNDSLKHPWHTLKGWLWCNPPYSPLKPWIVKAQEENKKGAKIVMLVPPHISSRYFADHLPTEIRIILGRLPFILDGKVMDRSTQDSCLLIYDTKRVKNKPLMKFIDRETLTHPGLDCL